MTKRTAPTVVLSRLASCSTKDTTIVQAIQDILLEAMLGRGKKQRRASRKSDLANKDDAIREPRTSSKSKVIKVRITS